MKWIFLLLLIPVLSCQQYPPSKQTSADSTTLVAAMDTEGKSDSNDELEKVMFDTVGLSAAPVKIILAKLVKKEYSNYRDIRLSYQNVSDKTITAIRFQWYGTNAFGEPAEMGGSIVRGFGGGFTDDILKAGRKDDGEWSISSRDAKKVELAWPTEVVFSDGTKWKSSSLGSAVR